jgi:hypothetical protein
MTTADYPPIFTATSIFTHHHLWLPTSFDQLFHFHTWPVSITHPSWPPLAFAQHYFPNSPFPPTTLTPNSDVFLMATSDHTPALTTTSIFTHDQFLLPTYLSYHFQFPTWPLSISQPIWPPLWITSRISILPQRIFKDGCFSVVVVVVVDIQESCLHSSSTWCHTIYFWLMEFKCWSEKYILTVSGVPDNQTQN